MKRGGRQVRRRLRRGVYLLPSLFTVANIFLGFFAIISGLQGAFQRAALLIFAAGLMDFFDGRIARLMGTDTEFGREYDSMADALTFGASPALLSYLWGLSEFGRPGWLVPLFYLVCAASRLARFNVQVRATDARYFVGLPVPAAAGAVASVLFFAPDSSWHTWLGAFLMLVLLLLGGLMVSTIRYPSLKQTDLKRRWSYRVILPIAAVLLVAAYHPPAFFLTAAVTYTLSGPLTWVFARTRRREEEAAEEAPKREGLS
jgi:CDP-diacylglycerol--serine O-phosphatidyltransferase